MSEIDSNLDNEELGKLTSKVIFCLVAGFGNIVTDKKAIYK